MNQEIQSSRENSGQKTEREFIKKNYFLPLSIVVSSLILGAAWIYTTESRNAAIRKEAAVASAVTAVIDENLIIPEEGVELPMVWGNLGAQLTEKGVIDGLLFESLYDQRGGLNEEMKNILYGSNNGKIKMTPQNAGFLLNIFWALGLGNKNPVLEQGPMSDPRYGGAGNFASTGGWTLAKGDAMDHYSKYNFINLTDDQQQLVERVSQGIYRPCCGNSTYFPDCNHGMAMLGLVELMASQGVSEETMYEVALKVNSYWFPDTYLTVAKYLQEKNTSFNKVDPKEILGKEYSSGPGFQAILRQVSPPENRGGGGCGV